MIRIVLAAIGGAALFSLSFGAADAGCHTGKCFSDAEWTRVVKASLSVEAPHLAVAALRADLNKQVAAK